MSSENPYQPTTAIPEQPLGVNKVKVKPFELIERGRGLIAGNYWLFLGIAFISILIGSAVPMGIIFGPMLVGLYFCYIDQESGRKVELSTLFKGFEYFKESLIAWLCIFAFTICAVLVGMLLIGLLIFLPMVLMMDQQQEPPPAFFLMLILGYILILFINLFAYLPFMFTFQLIADRKLDGVSAVKLSYRGVRENLWGVFGFLIVIMFLSILLAMMCYVPAILFMPISFAATFVLYRDIYGPPPQVPEAPAS